MKLFARRVDVAPDPLLVARTVAEEPGFAFLWSAVDGEPSYIACDPIARSFAFDPEPSLSLGPSESTLGTFPRWIGLLPYEACRGLERAGRARHEERAAPHMSEVIWYRFGAVARVGDDVLVAGDDEDRVTSLAARIRSGSRCGGDVGLVRLESEEDALHGARIEHAIELIAEGQIYQVNLSRRFDFRVSARAVDLVEGLTARTPARFAAAFAVDGLTVASSSPEMFLDLAPDGRMVTVPIKGTRPRGEDRTTDGALALALDSDSKERAELSMVVDVERNDLGRVARTGSVRLRGPARVEAHGSVHHRLQAVAARLRAGVGRAQLLDAMLPSGSVTGAPKIRAMEVIATLEAARRGLYTGAFGALRHDASLRLAMAIRTLTVRDGIGHYFAGGGIVAKSSPALEVAETRWKAVQLERLLSGFRCRAV